MDAKKPFREALSSVIDQGSLQYGCDLPSADWLIENGYAQENRQPSPSKAEVEATLQQLASDSLRFWGGENDDDR